MYVIFQFSPLVFVVFLLSGGHELPKFWTMKSFVGQICVEKVILGRPLIQWLKSAGGHQLRLVVYPANVSTLDLPPGCQFQIEGLVRDPLLKIKQSWW